MKELIDKLHIARRDKNLSLKDVAIKLNLTTGAVSHYETRIREPSFDTLVKWADILGLIIEIKLLPKNE